MRIIKIEAAADKKDRFILRFQDDTSLVCGLGEITEFMLSSDIELDREIYNKLVQACAYYKVKEKAASLLSARPMSVMELKHKLIEKGAAEDHAEKAVRWLEGLGILNDAEYAAMVARNYAGKGYGRARIRDELYKRRVSREFWDDAVIDLPDSSEKIDRLISLKLRGGIMDDKTKRKITESLRRRGFSWDEIKGAIVRYEDGTEDTED